jgi:transposase
MASKGKMAEKRSKAQQLYVRNGVLQQDIAALIGVSEKTISLWKNADGWDKQRAAVTTTKESELSRFYQQLSALNTAIEQRDPERRYPTATEADTQNKLSAAIAKLEQDTGLSATVNVFMRFTKWLREASDLETTKRFGELSDQYIKSLLV